MIFLLLAFLALAILVILAKSHKRPPIRRGILRTTITERDTNREFQTVVEVKELERCYEMSHIQIMKISGCPYFAKHCIRESTPDWIETSKIYWIS